MWVVINISEKMYEDCKVRNTLHYSLYDFSSMIVNGTPLPKGHGRLGDLSKIYDRLNDAQIEKTVEYKGLGEAKQIICDAPTIIEADKEHKHE